MSFRSGSESSDPHASFGGGRSLADPLARWKDDRGESDPRLTAAMESGNALDVVEALRIGRVFIALAKSNVNPEAHEKTSDMSVVCITSSDGRLGLLAFTSVESLSHWNQQARPIPIAGTDAAIAALDEGAEALIIDPAGPVPFTLTLPDLVALSGVDQRHRALDAIQLLLETSSITATSLHISEEGPLVLEIDSSDVEKVGTLLSARSDIHAYAPEGVALIAHQ